MEHGGALLTIASKRPTDRHLLRPHRTVILAAFLGTLLAYPVIAGAQPNAFSPRIIGGSTSPQGKWPAQGFLSVDRSACGGSLVSGRWFLTAAHCADSNDPRDYKVTLGRADRRTATPGDVFRVDRIDHHEDYTSNPPTSNPPNNDVTLLHLDRPTPTPLRPLRLVAANESFLWAPGTIATVIGWGVTRNGDDAALQQLQEATVPILDDATCAQRYGADEIGVQINATTMLCAGSGSTDTCNGDSGGPLMVPRQGEFVLAGVTSFGLKDGCADQRTPGVYARVGAPALNQWIRDRIPTVSISVAPAVPRAGDAIQLTATGLKPDDQLGNPSTTWDLDANGTYETPGATVSFALPAGSYPVAVEQIYPDGDRAQSRETVTVGPATPPPPPPVVSQAPAPGGSRTSVDPMSASVVGAPPFAAKLELARGKVLRSARRLSVLAPITARASGEVKVGFQAAGRTERFTAEIDAAKRRIRIDRSIHSAQARLGTGILTLTYPGDSDTQPQEVRLRAASQKANLDPSRPKISGDRLTAAGRISERASGVVRLQLLYEPAGQSTRTLQFTAAISNGRYRFDERLPADVIDEIATRRGSVHSYTLFTGYLARRIRGEMRSYEVLPAP